jgi:hypothetical protein
MKRLWFFVSLVLLMGCNNPTEEPSDPVYTYPTEITYKIGDPVPELKDVLVIQDENGTVVDTLDYTVRYGNLSWVVVGSYPITINHNGESHDVIVHVELDYTFELLGEDYVELELGEDFTDPGYRLVDHNGNALSNPSEWSSSTPVLDVDTYGDYILEYRFSAHGVEDSLTRTVRVLDAVPPVGTIVEERTTFLSDELPLNWHHFFYFTDDTDLAIHYAIYDSEDTEQSMFDGDGHYLLEATATDIHGNTTTMQKEVVIVTLPLTATHYDEVRAPWQFAMDGFVPVPSYYFEQTILPFQEDVLFIGLDETNEIGPHLSRRPFDDTMFQQTDWNIDLSNWPQILSFVETDQGFRMVYFEFYADITVLEISEDGAILSESTIAFPSGTDKLVHAWAADGDHLYLSLKESNGTFVVYEMTLDGIFTRMPYEDPSVSNLRLEWVNVLDEAVHLMYHYDADGSRHYRIVRMDESGPVIVLDQEGYLQDRYQFHADGSVYRWNNDRIESLNSNFEVLDRFDFDCLSNVRIAVGDTRLYVSGMMSAMCTAYTDEVAWEKGQALLVLDRTDLSLIQAGGLSHPELWIRRMITNGDDLMILFYEDTDTGRKGYVHVMDDSAIYDMEIPPTLEGDLSDLASMDLSNQDWLQAIPSDGGVTVHLDHLQAVDGIQWILYTFTLQGTPYWVSQPYHYRAGSAPVLTCSFGDTLVTPDLDSMLALCQATDAEDGDLQDAITVDAVKANLAQPHNVYRISVTDTDGYTTERLVHVLWLQDDTAFVVDHTWHDRDIHQVLTLDLWHHVTIETIPEDGLYLISYAYGEETARVALPAPSSGSYRLGMVEDTILLYGDVDLGQGDWDHLTLPENHPGSDLLLFDTSLTLVASPYYDQLPIAISSRWITLSVHSNTVFLTQTYRTTARHQYQVVPLDAFDGIYQTTNYDFDDHRYYMFDESGYYIARKDSDGFPNLAYVEHYDWNHQLLGTIPFGVSASGASTHIQGLNILDGQLCAYVSYYQEPTLSDLYGVPYGTVLMCLDEAQQAVPQYLITSIEGNVSFHGDSYAYLIASNYSLAFQTHDRRGQQTIPLFNPIYLSERHYAGHVLYGTITGPTLLLQKTDDTMQHLKTVVHIWTTTLTDIPYDDATANVTDVLVLHHNDTAVDYTVLDTQLVDGTWFVHIQPDGLDATMWIPLEAQ